MATSTATSSLSVGSHTVSATYSGDANFVTSTGTLTGGQTVNMASTTTTITNAASLSATPTVTGQGYTVNVSVAASAPGAGTPTGTVTVSDGTATCTTATLIAGAGSCTLVSTTAGAKTLTATYSGDANFTTSTSAGVAHTVNPAATTTTITNATALATPTVTGQGYAVMVSVAANLPGAGMPTGTVTVTDGTGATCTATLTAGTPSTGSCTLVSTTAGTKTLTATYNGDANFTTSTSAGVAHTVSPAATTTALASSSNPSVFGQPVAFTATVAPVAPGTGTPTGTVQFVVDGVNFGTPVALAGGVATSTATSSLSAGSHTVSATYSGDANFVTSTGTLTGGQTVNKASTTTTITNAASLSATPTVTGQGYTVNVSVAAVAPGAGTPTGTVTVIDGTGATCTTATLVAGAGSCTLTSTTAGSKTLTATYSGDTNFNTSTSAGVTHTVNMAATTTTVSSSANPSVFGQSVTFTATVAPVAPGTGTPTGTVQFVVDGANFGTPVALAGGMATSTATSSLSVGSHTVSATYSGDANFTTSTGTLTGGQTVNKFITTTTITNAASLSATPTVTGQGYAVNVSVAANAPGVGMPTGTVTVSDGSSTCTATLTAGTPSTGSCTLVSATAGTKTVTATYNGDANSNTSTSTGVTHTVNMAATTTIVTSSQNASAVGQPVTFKATVTATAPGSGTPTGTVQFVVDGANFGTPVALAAGMATSTATSTLTVGTHTVTATYSGDTNFTTSTGTLTGGQMVKAMALSTFTLFTATESRAISPQTIAITGGTAPFTCTIAGQPTGLTVVAVVATCVLSGTPGAGTSAGSPYTVMITATDSTLPVANTDTKSSVLTVVPALAFVTASPLPNAEQSTLYNLTITTSGGQVPRSVMVTVPPSAGCAGLTLTANSPMPGQATLVGTPTTAGTCTFTLTVSDTANSTSPSGSLAMPYTLTIVSPLAITTTSLVNALKGFPYSPVTLATSGGLGTAKTWSVTAGDFTANAGNTSTACQGFSLAGSTGVLSGTPVNAGLCATAGSGTFTVTVTEASNGPSAGGSATKNLSIQVLDTFGYVAGPGGKGPMGHDTVEIINTGGKSFVGQIDVGSATGPAGIALTRNGRKAFVTLNKTNAFLVIDTTNNTVAGPTTFASCTGPKGITIGTVTTAAAGNPTGELAYVACKHNAMGTSPQIAVINTATNAEITAAGPVSLIPAAGTMNTDFTGIAISPDGSQVFATDTGGEFVVVATITNMPSAGVATCMAPKGIAITPDGTRAYIACDNQMINVRSTSSPFTSIVTVTAGSGGATPTNWNDVGVTPDGKRVYVTSANTGEFTVLDNTLATPAPIPVGIGAITVGSAALQGVSIPATTATPFLVFIADSTTAPTTTSKADIRNDTATSFPANATASISLTGGALNPVAGVPIGIGKIPVPYLIIGTLSLSPTPAASSAYTSTPLAALGGVGALTWSATFTGAACGTGGTINSSTGVISITTTGGAGTGMCSIAVTVTDSATPTAQTASATFTFTL